MSWLSWIEAAFIWVNAARASTIAFFTSDGSLPASALRVASSCGPSSMAIRPRRSAVVLSLAKVLLNSATASGNSASVLWILVLLGDAGQCRVEALQRIADGGEIVRVEELVQ